MPSKADGRWTEINFCSEVDDKWDCSCKHKEEKEEAQEAGKYQGS